MSLLDAYIGYTVHVQHVQNPSTPYLEGHVIDTINDCYVVRTNSQCTSQSTKEETEYCRKNDQPDQHIILISSTISDNRYNLLFPDEIEENLDSVLFQQDANLTPSQETVMHHLCMIGYDEDQILNAFASRPIQVTEDIQCMEFILEHEPAP